MNYFHLMHKWSKWRQYEATYTFMGPRKRLIQAKVCTTCGLVRSKPL